MDRKSHGKNKKLFFLSFTVKMSISIENVFGGIVSFSTLPDGARPGMERIGSARTTLFPLAIV
jgi:hypothetical protein